MTRKSNVWFWVASRYELQYNFQGIELWTICARKSTLISNKKLHFILFCLTNKISQYLFLCLLFIYIQVLLEVRYTLGLQINNYNLYTLFSLNSLKYVLKDYDRIKSDFQRLT